MTIPAGRLRFGPGNGQVLLRTHRAGLAARVGHDLTIEIAAWSVEVDSAGPSQEPARVVATMDLRSFVVRGGTGGAVPLTDRDRAEIEKNARRILGVDRHPVAAFESDRIERRAGGGTVTGNLTLHGRSGPAAVEVEELGTDRVRASARVTQTAFGITPYSAFLGALKLRDEVEVECEVDLAAAKTETA